MYIEGANYRAHTSHLFDIFPAIEAEDDVALWNACHARDKFGGKYMVNHRISVGQTATAILNINLVDNIAGGFEQTATQYKIEMEATLTGEAP